MLSLVIGIMAIPSLGSTLGNIDPGKILGTSNSSSSDSQSLLPPATVSATGTSSSTPNDAATSGTNVSNADANSNSKANNGSNGAQNGSSNGWIISGVGVGAAAILGSAGYVLAKKRKKSKMDSGSWLTGSSKRTTVTSGTSTSSGEFVPTSPKGSFTIKNIESYELPKPISPKAEQNTMFSSSIAIPVLERRVSEVSIASSRMSDVDTKNVENIGSSGRISSVLNEKQILSIGLPALDSVTSSKAFSSAPNSTSTSVCSGKAFSMTPKSPNFF